MLPVAHTSPSTPSNNEGYQVLNISNVNALNEIVLNDEQLLELIQQYPFLYNPHVRPHNDIDYDAWAWEQITKAFNRTYENLDRNVWFTTIEIIERWKVLQPIVRSLSKINNMKSLPDTLRQTVVKMSVPLDEIPNEKYKKSVHKLRTQAQQTLLQYESLVNSLPLSSRRRLEAEMLELILQSELESKATIKLGLHDLKTIENEYNDFLRTIGLCDLHFVDENSNGSEQSSNNSDDVSFVPNPTNCNEGTGLLANNHAINNDLDSGIGIGIFGPPGLSSISVRTDDAMEIEPESTTSGINEAFQVEPEVIKNKISEAFYVKIDALDVVDVSLKDDMSPQFEAEESLLKPLVRRWVPLNDWRQYVRKCRVRIKRTVIEDDLPLAIIKREKLSN